ncbi:uncharacterized protein LOC129947251 [Eupeodes corollae]|uniref:uncharacterized protein LOC129947251 n=1 Tax=Eupeodes corollae TaxID=290404 RepID=UPI002492CFDA|nr:uncharacterized protein LOC129947251 [Eupeodes corollae]
MRIFQLAVITAALLTITTANELSWSWSGAKTEETKAPITRRSTEATDTKESDKEEAVEGRYLTHEPVYSNDTEINDIIEHILTGRREGRNLGDYDKVYADGNVEMALQQGDDLQARNLIKEKLCVLGLMSCDPEEKRPFYSTIYAQGPPPPNRVGGPYGPPRPMPTPGNHYGPPPGTKFGPTPPNSFGPSNPNNKFGPPRKVGYEGPLSKPFYGRPPGVGPVYNGPFLESPPPSAIDSSVSFSKPPPGAIIYGSKPPGPVFEGVDAPYNFESTVGEKIQVASSHQNNFYAHQSGSSNKDESLALSASTLQQHVHHHYHHVEGEGSSAKAPSVSVPIGGGSTINTGFSALAQSSAGFAPVSSGGFSESSAFAAGFNGASQGSLISGSNGFNGNGFSSEGFGSNGFNSVQKPNAGELYKPPGGGLGSFSSSGNGGFGQNSGSGFGSNGLSGSYHSQNPDYFKKELHSGSSSQYGGNSFNGGYNDNKYAASQFGSGYDTSRQQNIDCICVPFNQCPAADRIGRKDDLILPIDPRNIGKDIEALSDEAAANITSSAVSDKEASNKEDSKKSKREAPAEDKQSSDGDDIDTQASDAEGRQADFFNRPLPTFGLTQRKVLPTFGVSFGLPQPAGAYPINSIGPNGLVPAPNQHFGAISPNGLNLGLINVNPLVSLQVSKTEFGDKVVKPLVNLHVTPNENIIQKVGDLFKPKHPKIQHNHHYHHHDHYDGDGHNHHHSPIIHHDHPEHYVDHHPTGPSGPFYHSEAPSYITGPGPHHSSHHHSHDHGHTSPAHNYYPSTGPYGSSGPSYPSSGPSHHSHHSSGPTHLTSRPSYPSSGHSYPPAGPPHLTSGPSYPSSGHSYPPSEPPHLTSGPSYPSSGHSYPPSGPSYPPLSDDIYGSYDRSSNYSRSISKPITFNGAQASSGLYSVNNRYGKQLNYPDALRPIPTQAPGAAEGSAKISFPRDRRRRSADEGRESVQAEERAYYGNGRPGVQQQCRGNEVCCRRPFRPPQQQQLGRCGTRNAAGITGRIKNPVYVDGDSEFGEYPWHVAILKKDPKESVYVCGGTLIDGQHIITAAHCIKTYQGFDLRVRMGEWDVNHDVEFFPYIERDVVSVHVHPEYYAGTLDNDLAVLKFDQPIDFTKNPHISPACLPEKFSDFTGARCWTTGWGKDAFGDHGKYQNILKEVDVPILGQQQCQNQLRQTRLGYNYKLNPGFVCAGGEEGKDACKGDGGGPLVCERNGYWNVVGVVSWGIGCGEVNVPGVYVRVSHYLDWIRQITQYYK